MGTPAHTARSYRVGRFPSLRDEDTRIPCQTACPVHTDARGYIQAIRDGEFERAYWIARGPNPFASICGRVCGAPCEAACRRGKIPIHDADGRWLTNDQPVAIRALKRFACERAGVAGDAPGETVVRLRAQPPAEVGRAEEVASLVRASIGLPESALPHRVAIIGAGPAGLTAAHDLSVLGIRSVVYEAEAVPAGMLALGIPEFRLPRSLIEHEVRVIEALGVEIRCGRAIGEDVSFADLRRDYDAVIVAVGAKRPRALGLPGEAGAGVFGGVDFLRSVATGSPPAVGKRVVVIGGGNVAYDVARTVIRQVMEDAARTVARMVENARVTIVSLESLEEMPADTSEIVEGDREGIHRLGGFGPAAITRGADGRVEGVVVHRCVRLFGPDGKFSPVFDDADSTTLPCDTVLFATGQRVDLGFLADGGSDVELEPSGWPVVDRETLATTAAGVFVAGDLAHGTRLLIDAVASGKRAARSVYAHLTGRTLHERALTARIPLGQASARSPYADLRRVPVPMAPVEERLRTARISAELGYDEAGARREASRCLDCSVRPAFDGRRCVLCGGCVETCPTACLKLVPLPSVLAEGQPPVRLHEPATRSRSAILQDGERCLGCGLCASRCPHGAIVMERLTCTTEWYVE